MNTVSDWESEGGAVADEEVIAKWRKHAQDIRSRNFVGRDAGMDEYLALKDADLIDQILDDFEE